ncbi:DUF1318 domain-containing protein [Phenylobacterium sp. J426]|uniref:DUF1318 domain-containing protein n=1 Tax=Phenylobacterium sp. J426 TaxID=2898439 RepID=UPI0027E2F5F6|nr:DUF1318 domain-containing protein [Phenylobacterium sp. J426]
MAMNLMGLSAPVGAAVLAALVAATPVAAQAMNAKAAVDAAKAQGVVGEQADGFLGFVKPSTDTALKAAVDEINAGRAQLYREAAAKNGVSVEAAGALGLQHRRPVAAEARRVLQAGRRRLGPQVSRGSA